MRSSFRKGRTPHAEASSWATQTLTRAASASGWTMVWRLLYSDEDWEPDSDEAWEPEGYLKATRAAATATVVAATLRSVYRTVNKSNLKSNLSENYFYIL